MNRGSRLFRLVDLAGIVARIGETIMAVAALRNIRTIKMSIVNIGIGNGAALFFGARGTPGITPRCGAAGSDARRIVVYRFNLRVCHPFISFYEWFFSERLMYSIHSDAFSRMCP